MKGRESLKGRKRFRPTRHGAGAHGRGKTPPMGSSFLFSPFLGLLLSLSFRVFGL
jgi:hypothetical protein